MPAMTTRIGELRKALDWRQPQMAEYLGLSQPAISNMERGQPEAGPIQRLLDILAEQRGFAHLTAERFAGPTPDAGDA